jgi:SAM-dependent methyltransferase
MTTSEHLAFRTLRANAHNDAPPQTGGATAAYDAGAYGRQLGADYDRFYSEVPDTDAAVEKLAAWAGGGRILEFGLGSGRLALPLAARGLEVHGIEGSPEMDALLKAKPGGDAITTTIGDFAETVVGEGFDLVVLALNTIFGMPTQAQQVACFENAARHLAPGGRFLVEAFVLDPMRFRDGAVISPRLWGTERVELQVQAYDPATQCIDTRNIHLGDQYVRVLNVRNQYAAPRELDLMARIAGFALEERWGGWRDEPFDVRSTRHVSLYRLAA